MIEPHITAQRIINNELVTDYEIWLLAHEYRRLEEQASDGQHRTVVLRSALKARSLIGSITLRPNPNSKEKP